MKCEHGVLEGHCTDTSCGGYGEPTWDIEEVKAALIAAAEAAEGDSNDDEINALFDCRDLLAQITGLSTDPRGDTE